MVLCSNFDFNNSTCTQVDIGFDYTISLTHNDALGNPIDLTSFTFQMIIKDGLAGSTLLTLNEVATDLLTGLYIPSPTTGVIRLQITDTDTALIAVGVYPYEFTQTDTDSEVKIFMQGTIQFFDRGF